MTYEQEFLKDFEAWVVTQVKVNETALAASKKIWEEDGDEQVLQVERSRIGLTLAIRF